MFIERQSHISGENGPEQSWLYREAKRVTKNYSGKQHISYYQPSQYN